MEQPTTSVPPTLEASGGQTLRIVEDDSGYPIAIAISEQTPLDEDLRYGLEQHTCGNPDRCQVSTMQRQLKGEAITDDSLPPEHLQAILGTPRIQLVDTDAGANTAVMTTNYDMLPPGMVTSACDSEPPCAPHQLFALYLAYKSENGEEIPETSSVAMGLPEGLISALIAAASQAGSRPIGGGLTSLDGRPLRRSRPRIWTPGMGL